MEVVTISKQNNEFKHNYKNNGKEKLPTTWKEG